MTCGWSAGGEGEAGVGEVGPAAAGGPADCRFPGPGCEEEPGEQVPEEARPARAGQAEQAAWHGKVLSIPYQYVCFR